MSAIGAGAGNGAITSTSTSAPISLRTQNYPVIECVPNMEILHQVSGQCWDDAAIVFLWFSSGMGPIIQQRLQEKQLVEEFELWLRNTEIKDGIKNLFPNVFLNYRNFTNTIIDYLSKLQERYLLFQSISEPTKKKNTRQRALSENFSLNLEFSGIAAGDILDVNNDKCRVSQGAGGGYFIDKFANVLYILIHFFLRGRLKLLLFNKEESSTYGDLLKLQNGPIFIHNIYNSSIKSALIPLNDAESILKNIDDNFRISFQGDVGVYTSAGWGYGHVITFLTCEDGNYYLFDNNTYILTKINWPVFFKTVDFRRTTILYIDNINNIPKTFRGLDVPQQVPMLILVYDDRISQVMIKTTDDGEYLYEIDNNDERFSGYHSLIDEGFKSFYVLRYIASIFFNPGKNENNSTLNFELLNQLSAKNIEAKTAKEALTNARIAQKKNILKHLIKNNIGEIKKIIEKADIKTLNDLFLDIVLNPPIDNTTTIETLKLLIANGANPRRNEDLLFRTAIGNNNYEIAEFLLSLGADINAKGGRALKQAFWPFRPDFKKVKWLVDRNADINIADGWILYSLLGKTTTSCNQIKFLIELGAKVVEYPIIIEKLISHTTEYYRFYECIYNALNTQEKKKFNILLLKKLITNFNCERIKHLIQSDIFLLKNDEILKYIGTLENQELYMNTRKCITNVINTLPNDEVKPIQDKITSYRLSYLRGNIKNNVSNKNVSTITNTSTTTTSSSSSTRGGYRKKTKKRKSNKKKKTRKH